MNLQSSPLEEESGVNNLACSPKKVSITIDDVPNTSRFKKDKYQSLLLNELDSLQIPIAVFINEGFIYRTDAFSKNLELLNNWASKEFITLGNHSFKHSRYSTTTFDLFINEIVKGESITRQLAKRYKKNLAYFRFPYNDLGKDNIQYLQIKDFLKDKEYIIAPYTIGSLDYMYNLVYEFYHDNKDFEKANEIGKEYLKKTLEFFDFFEDLAKKNYGRAINQIYFCHDNKINTDFLQRLINELRKREYEFISLENALKDEVYQQKDNFIGHWGISWLYRWQATYQERIDNIKKQPSVETIVKQYERILKLKNE